MGKVRDYRDLIVWQKGIDLVTEVYGVTKAFPKTEAYGLSNQLQRSAVSVPSNIAEGQARQQSGDFRRFLQIALGSLAELHTQLIIAHKLNYITIDDLVSLEQSITEIQKMLHKLISRLPRKNSG